MKQNEMEVIILGSGTCIPAADREPSGILVKVNSENLLFDSGSGTLHKLNKIGVDYRQLQYLFYTHTHPDHTIDLVPLLQAIRVAPQFSRKLPIYIHGPSQFSEFIKRLAHAYGDWILFAEFEVFIKELNHDLLEFPFGKITTAPMKHSQHSIGYRIDSQAGKAIVYSGDTDYCEAIIDLATHCDILILECSFPDNQRMAGHLTPSLAARIATESHCKHLILTHFYPLFENIDIVSICRKIYDGKISLAYDLMRVNL